jgi:hypothetical protein
VPVNEQAKKQRTTNVPHIRVKSEIVTTVEEVVTVKTEEIDDGSTGESFLDVSKKIVHRIQNLTSGGNINVPLFYHFCNMINIAYDHSASESALCEPSSDPHLSHSASTSSTTSKQFTSQVGTSNNAEMCAFEGRVESDVDSLPNQDSENLPMNNVFSELQREEELEYEEVAQNSTAHKRAAIPLVLNTNQKRKYQSWDERSKELVDFKKVNGHTNVPQGSGPLGNWVSKQRAQYRLLKEGKDSALTIERRDKLEGIGFTFIRGPARPHWDQRFQELVEFRKINGHTNVPQGSGPLGIWVQIQRTQYRILKEENASPLTFHRREKLEGIGFTFICGPARPPWDQRFQELVNFKKINGHTNVPKSSGLLWNWVSTQQQAFRLLKEGKDTPLTIDRREKLEGI